MTTRHLRPVWIATAVMWLVLGVFALFAPLPVLNLVTETLFYLGLAGIVAFTLLYGLRSTWYRWPEGRALMAQSTSLTVISLFVASSLTFGNSYPGRMYVRFGAYAFFAVASVWFAVILVRRQRAQRKEREALMTEYAAAAAREALDVELLNRAGEVENPVPVRIVRRRRFPWWVRRPKG